MKKTVFCFLLTVIVISSCKKNNSNETPPVAQTNIYVVGGASGGNDNPYACYWKNGIKTDLTSATAFTEEAEAKDVAITSYRSLQSIILEK